MTRPARSLLFLLLLASSSLAADTSDTRSNPMANYFAHWWDRVDTALAEQPPWPSGFGTTTPRLTELLRYDISWQSLKGGHELVNFGSSKGLEFVPSEHIQITVSIPPYMIENTHPAKSGFGDQSFMVKYRFLSANEENGNYIFTGFMTMTVPNGSANFTTHHYVYSPSIAGGKGFGNFAIWGTTGFNIPDNAGDEISAGLSLPANLVMQYRVRKYFWPGVEANYTHWITGEREGENQLFTTPGLIIGNLPVWSRIKLLFGAGCQIAVTDNPIYHRSAIFTSRLIF